MTGGCADKVLKVIRAHTAPERQGGAQTRIISLSAPPGGFLKNKVCVRWFEMPQNDKGVRG